VTREVRRNPAVTSKGSVQRSIHLGDLFDPVLAGGQALGRALKQLR
jgi:hypothetical protein